MNILVYILALCLITSSITHSHLFRSLHAQDTGINIGLTPNATSIEFAEKSCKWLSTNLPENCAVDATKDECMHCMSCGHALATTSCKDLGESDIINCVTEKIETDCPSLKTGHCKTFGKQAMKCAKDEIMNQNFGSEDKPVQEINSRPVEEIHSKRLNANAPKVKEDPQPVLDGTDAGNNFAHKACNMLANFALEDPVNCSTRVTYDQCHTCMQCGHDIHHQICKAGKKEKTSKNEKHLEVDAAGVKCVYDHLPMCKSEIDCQVYSKEVVTCGKANYKVPA